MGIFGFLANSDSKRSLKKLNKIADSVEALDSKYAAMDDETLKSQTNVLKERLKAGETTDDILPDAFAALRTTALLMHPAVPTGCELVAEHMGFATRDFFSWEQFFTHELIEKTRGTFLTYSKSRLNESYLAEHTRGAIEKGLPSLGILPKRSSKHSEHGLTSVQD